jgi:hypothetical protein
VRDTLCADPSQSTATVSANRLVRGQAVTISGGCMVPDTDVQVTIESTPIYLATLHADAQGNYRGTVVIPASMPLGEHHLVVTGLGRIGAVSHRSSAPVTVVAAQTTGGGLPRTGRDLARWFLVGLGAVALGAALRTARRDGKDASS